MRVTIMRQRKYSKIAQLTVRQQRSAKAHHKIIVRRLSLLISGLTNKRVCIMAILSCFLQVFICRLGRTVNNKIVRCVHNYRSDHSKCHFVCFVPLRNAQLWHVWKFIYLSLSSLCQLVLQSLLSEVSGFTIASNWMSKKLGLVQCMFSYSQNFKVFKPKRVFCCSRSDLIIEKLNHHCPLLSKCVGKNNIKAFYVFILPIILHSFSSDFLFIRQSLLLPHHDSLLHKYIQIKLKYFLIFLVFIAIPCLVSFEAQQNQAESTFECLRKYFLLLTERYLIGEDKKILKFLDELISSCCRLLFNFRRFPQL